MKNGMKLINGKRFYLIELSDQDLAVIEQGLIGLAVVPFGLAAPVLESIRKQLQPDPVAKQPDSDLLEPKFGNR
jgi:hypothetical protein